MGAVAKVVAGIGLATVGAFTPGGGWLVGIGVPAAVGGVAERLPARRRTDPAGPGKAGRA